jgi:hypothetical protein
MPEEYHDWPGKLQGQKARKTVATDIIVSLRFLARIAENP